MWPWGHAAVAYLCYSALLRARGRRPGGVAVLLVGVGSQLPDLVDKPLAWTFAVLAHGRSLAHSLLVVGPVLALLWWRFGDDHPRAVVALAVGWLSHSFADGLWNVVEWELADLGYLLWPVTSAAPPEIAQSFLAHFRSLALDDYFAFQLVIVVAALVVWRQDGYPGLALVRSRVGRLVGETPE